MLQILYSVLQATFYLVDSIDDSSSNSRWRFISRLPDLIEGVFEILAKHDGEEDGEDFFVLAESQITGFYEWNTK